MSTRAFLSPYALKISIFKPIAIAINFLHSSVGNMLENSLKGMLLDAIMSHKIIFVSIFTVSERNAQEHNEESYEGRRSLESKEAVSLLDLQPMLLNLICLLIVFRCFFVSVLISFMKPLHI